jgi:hypothetical protein
MGGRVMCINGDSGCSTESRCTSAYGSGARVIRAVRGEKWLQLNNAHRPGWYELRDGVC